MAFIDIFVEAACLFCRLYRNVGIMEMTKTILRNNKVGRLAFHECTVINTICNWSMVRHMDQKKRFL